VSVLAASDSRCTPSAASFDLARLTARRFPAGSRPLTRPSRQFLEAALPRFGQGTGSLSDAEGQGYLAMMQALLEDAPVEEDVDLTVVSLVVPDFDLDNLAGVGAASATPGSTAMLGVSDHGRATTFMALRLATLLAARRGVDRVAVFAADQVRMPYPTDEAPAADRPGDTDDVAALLLLTRRPTPGGMRLAHGSLRRGEVPVSQAVQDVYDELLGDGPPPATVVAGPDCGSWSPGEGVALVRSQKGLPASGVWEAAAGIRRDGPVVALEVDLELGEVAGAWI
jgi:hypothetical protein